MESKFMLNSPLKSPFSAGVNAYLPMTSGISPVKIKSEPFSPFKIKEETISPLKGVVLSPFKVPGGSNGQSGMDFPTELTNFDDWDKDFIANFEENIFGMNDLSDNVIGELLKSPQGKAMLEMRNASPIRSAAGMSAVRKLKISPPSKGFITISPMNGNASHGQILGNTNQNTFNVMKMKQEKNEQEYFLNTQEALSPDGILLSVTDPNKMSATPVLQKFSSTERVAPKRKLSMKTPSVVPTVSTSQLLQKENLSPLEWPSTERLKYARDRFKLTLAKAVEDFIQSSKPKPVVKESVKQPVRDKSIGGKGKRAAKNTRKSKPKDRYPQIKKALAKPAVANSSVVHAPRSQGGKRASKATVYKQSDWILDDGQEEEEEEEEEEENTWRGPLPFSSQSLNLQFSDDGDESEDEYWEPPSYNRGKKCGYRVLVKKRKRTT